MVEATSTTSSCLHGAIGGGQARDLVAAQERRVADGCVKGVRLTSVVSHLAKSGVSKNECVFLGIYREAASGLSLGDSRHKRLHLV